MKSYQINFIRHGQTEANLQGAYIGVTDVHLSPKGREQLLKISDEQGYPRRNAYIKSSFSLS